MSISAPYPYNFVIASFLLGICAVRGYCGAVRWAVDRWAALKRISPLFYLFPLVLVLPQLDFVEGGTTNLEQLETLRKIEAHSAPDDVIIDNDGSALFRPHRGYYWYHGRAHVQMFEDYYRDDFIDDLRATRAPFWITGLRTKQLPDAARRYLLDHYVPFRGDLFVLGYTFPESSLGYPREGHFDVVRSGEYHWSPPPFDGGHLDEAAILGEHQVRIDGNPMTASSVHLDIGSHQVWIGVGAPAYRLSYLPPSAFDDSSRVGRHAPLFEYDRPR
jgi:hypothetical protein